MTMPEQKPGRSKQDYGTPADFRAALAKKFGPLEVDLAARADNAKAPIFITPEMDSLTHSWWPYLHQICWLNPPFANIRPWAARCEAYLPGCAVNGGKILFLTPASVGANWFRDHVMDKARVYLLCGRLTFEGETLPYPKDCILSVFGESPGFELWEWRLELEQPAKCA